MVRAIATRTVRLPRKVIEELYDTSTRLISFLETLDVLTDKQTMRRTRTGEKEDSKRWYVVAKDPVQIRTALS